ncbi:hypothetical protein [Thiohalobacter thiocyanaticus]|nr:hypothetical protein [Thiohalobacter thiocyanaticus]
MSEADKTGDKLVASMRKTKAGAAQAAGTQQKSRTASRGSKPAAARKTPARKTGAPPRAEVEADPYQSGRRIWPD